MKRDRRIVQWAAMSAGIGALAFSAAAYSAFGAGQLFDNVSVVRIFSGTSTTYVEFSEILPGCNSRGGYLTPSWTLSNGGVVNEPRTSQMVATLLTAKAAGFTMEVRYRVNDAGTGWNNCTIDSVFLH